MARYLWLSWLFVTLAIGGYYGYTMFYSEDKSELLIGEATHGHFQIELACTACHTDPFGGQEVLQSACLNCHASDLEEAHDSHPRKKFTDPRNADRIEILDARYCVSCHTEHQLSHTNAMGVTLPEDYCWHCHQDIGTERPSHAGLEFNSCASAGCHNFHDNRALYEDFLTKHAGGSWLAEIAAIPARNGAAITAYASLPLDHPTIPEKAADYPDIQHAWQSSKHAEAGVTCNGCHAPEGQEWVDSPAIENCATCHAFEAETYQMGKHGMRLAQGLDPVSPQDGRLEFAESALEQHQSCNSCHAAHDYDTRVAAKDSCLTCHADRHSLAFDASPHGQLFDRAMSGELALEQAVSCATCHMPRIDEKVAGQNLVQVQHNQNWNLRPNEKMIRSVCLDCHNLEFSIDALADPELIQTNFAGKPGQHVPSIDWALERLE